MVGFGYAMWPGVQSLSHGAVYAEMLQNGDLKSSAHFADFLSALSAVGKAPIGIA